MKMKLNKKAQFQFINEGMIAFIGFVLICILIVVFISTYKQSSVACQDGQYDSTMDNCVACRSGFTWNASKDVCCNYSTTGCEGANSTTTTFPSSAANATPYFIQASLIAPQFASIIVIAMVVVGILAVLGWMGYHMHKKMNE
jgi:cell division protein FtsX